MWVVGRAFSSVAAKTPFIPTDPSLQTRTPRFVTHSRRAMLFLSQSYPRRHSAVRNVFTFGAIVGVLHLSASAVTMVCHTRNCERKLGDS